MIRAPLPFALLALLAGCSAESSFMQDAGAAYDDTGAEGEGEDEGDYDYDTGAAGEDTYAPEDENDFLKLAPAATDAYVFVANPTRNTVTRVSVPSLAVITADVGVDPEVVVTTDDYTRAVTFNAGSDTVSIIESASLAVTEVEVRPNMNTMELSPDGAWVICYHDQAGEDFDSDDGGVTSFNEVSLVNLANATAYAEVVGFNPRDVQFTSDGRLAVVVSDAYLGVIDLTSGDTTPMRIALTDETVDPPEAEEVLLSQDGSFAFVRQFGAPGLLVVDLAAGTVNVVDVGDSPTDLDLTPDGKKAVAVARGANELWVYDMADPYATPEVLAMPEGEVLGSVLMSPDNTRGLLYSTASGVSHISEWDIDSGLFTVYGLVKPISTIGITPDGSTALIFHDKDNGADVDPDSVFYGEYGLTLVDLTDFFQSALLLPSEPKAYANSAEGDIGYFIMENQDYLEVLDYGSLLYEEVPLKSQPVHVGVLPESRLAYVNQEHDLGRLSFYDPDSQELQTLTGFELNSAIEHED